MQEENKKESIEKQMDNLILNESKPEASSETNKKNTESAIVQQQTSNNISQNQNESFSRKTEQIFGLVGGIASVAVGLYLCRAALLIGAFMSLASDKSDYTFIFTFIFLSITIVALAIVGIIGAIIVNNKPKNGGTGMLFSSIGILLCIFAFFSSNIKAGDLMYIIEQIKVIIYETGPSIFLIVLPPIPLFVAGLIALIRKRKITKKKVIITLAILISIIGISTATIMYIDIKSSSWTNVESNGSTEGNTKIWYLKTEDGGHLCRIDTNGKNEFCTEERAHDYSFSPDGEYVSAILYNEAKKTSSPAIIDTKNFKRKDIISGGTEIFQWSPNGKFIAYIDEENLYTINISTKEIKLIANGVDSLSWYKNGKNICFKRLKVTSDRIHRFAMVNVETKEQKELGEYNDRGTSKHCSDFVDEKLIYYSQIIYMANTNSESEYNGRKISFEADGPGDYDTDNIFINGKLIRKSDGINSGFSNPQWIPGSDLFVFDGWSSSPYIYIGDSKTGKIKKLAEGMGAGVYQSPQNNE